MVGLVILSIGLFKKTVLADTLATYADPIFNHDVRVGALSPAVAWLAGITFSFQLYFDFSGYSDMAIGLARMFGVKLPLNFHSPLRAPSIIEYWRRWHMTLQRFVYAYIFQPLTLPLTRLAGERGLAAWPTFALAVALPLFITFVAVGIWHGAGWTYVAYGVMQAVYVCTNQSFRELRVHRRRALRKQGRILADPTRAQVLLYQAITLLAVLFSNVMFRARTVSDAVTLWGSMLNLTEGTSPQNIVVSPVLLAMLVISASIVFLAPNTQQIMRRFGPAQNWREWKDVAPPTLSWTWKPSPIGVLLAGTTLFLGVIFIERGPGVFLYFNF
jgi:D-alanyl-lipoteichoic acid acyltransferase DltB (MBOAT superfamily)